MKMFAFIKGSTPNTARTVARASNEIDVWERPQSEVIPQTDTDDIIVVVHVSQPYDDDSGVEAYRCFDACVDAICDGIKSDDNFNKHQSWMLAHSDHIKGIVLTSGGSIEPGKLARAEQKLYQLRPDISFMPLDVSELAALLRGGQLQDTLFSRNKIELALKCLSALWPFDLMWQAKGKDQLQTVVPNPDPVERAIALRLKNKLGDKSVDWDLQRVGKSIMSIDEMLRQGNRVTDLDEALELLANSEGMHAEEWYPRYVSLRKELMKCANG
jgi:hypothetical protein